MTKRNGTAPMTPRKAAQLLWEMGANVNAIPADSKRTINQWKAWEGKRQTREVINNIVWDGKPSYNGSEPIPPAATVGVICGVSDWRCLDIDAAQDADGNKLPVSETVVWAVLDALGLDRTYHWYGRSRSGNGWHIWCLCAGELPPDLAQAGKAKESGVKVGTPTAEYAGLFDHVELRWERCQTVLPAPTGYNGHLPDEPPATVEIDQVSAAFLAIARPKQPEARQQAPRQQRQAPTPLNRNETRERAYIEASVRGKVEDALSRVRRAPDGQKHYTLRDMALLLGGLVHYGVFRDDELADLLYQEIAHTAEDLHQAEKTIAWGIDQGAATPLTVEGPIDTPRHSTQHTRSSPPPSTRPIDDQSQAEQGSPPQRRLLSSDEVLALPPASWLIDLVLPASDLTVIYGLPGTGKSMIALDIACVLAQHMPVVYVAAEALHTNTSRLAAWQTHYGRKTDNLHWWDGPVNLLNALEVELFLATIAPLGPRAIFFDTLAMCMPGSEENGNADMSQAVGQLMKIRERTGAAVVPVHHSDKAGLTPRGHSSLIGACSSIIKVTNDDGMIVFRSEKQRNGKPFDARLFHLVEKPEVDGVVLLPTSKVDQRNSPPSERALLVLEELCEPLNDDGVNQKEIADALGLHPQQVSRAVRKLEHQGYIQLVFLEKRKVLIPTRAGHALVAQHTKQTNQQAQDTGQGPVLNWEAVIGHTDGRSHPDHTLITPDHTPPRDRCDQGSTYTPIEGYDSPSGRVITLITPESAESEGGVIEKSRVITPDHIRSHPDHTPITPDCDHTITRSHPCGPFRGHGECDQGPPPPEGAAETEPCAMTKNDHPDTTATAPNDHDQVLLDHFTGNRRADMVAALAEYRRVWLKGPEWVRNGLRTRAGASFWPAVDAWIEAEKGAQMQRGGA